MTASTFRRLLAVASLSVAATAAFAQAEPYPSKPIRMIVPFAAGSGTDVSARAIVAVMGPALKTTFVIENRPGANGLIAAQAAARSPNDGYTVFMTTLTTQSVNPHLYKSLPYDPVGDFDPVGLVGVTSPVLLRRPDLPATTLPALVDAARRAPGAMNVGTSNTSSLFATQMFEHQAKVTVNKVRYTNTGQAHGDVAGGRLDFIFGDFTSGGGLIQAGKLVPMAVASPSRLRAWPDIPTLAEAGLPGIEVEIWVGMLAPKGTPAPIVRMLNESLNAALDSADVKSGLERQATTPRPMKIDEFRQYMAAQYDHWGRMARLLKVEPE